jgi:hypothetical protein
MQSRKESDDENKSRDRCAERRNQMTARAKLKGKDKVFVGGKWTTEKKLRDNYLKTGIKCVSAKAALGVAIDSHIAAGKALLESGITGDERAAVKRAIMDMKAKYKKVER